MTRNEQLQFCKKCLNRKMSLQTGILCGITGEKASFEVECKDFALDETVKVVVDEETPLETADIARKLSGEAYQRIKEDQDLKMGIMMGLLVGLICSILWGVITVVTEYQIAYMAVAVGAAVGYGIRYFGKGIDPIFGYWGAAIALMSCVVGNFLSIVGFAANSEGLGYVETLTLIDYSLLPEIMIESFSGMDILFYGLALYEGYKFSFRVITEKDLLELEKSAA